MYQTCLAVSERAARVEWRHEARVRHAARNAVVLKTQSHLAGIVTSNVGSL